MTAEWPTADETTIKDVADQWAGGYLVTAAPGIYRAVFRYDTTVVLHASTPEGLDSACRAHWSRTWAGGYAGVPSAPWDLW